MTTRRVFLAGTGSLLGATLAGCRPWRGSGDVGSAASFGVPRSTTPDLVGHVLSRCSFGPRPGDRDQVTRRHPDPRRAVESWLEEQLAPERIDDRPAERAAARYPALQLPAGELYEFHRAVLLQDLTSTRVLRAVLSRRQLHEVMVEVWTDHFNIDMSKGDCGWLKVADDRDVIRRHALGCFPELLRASAASPAMLWYLDGRVNRRATPRERPNENYARELLELHTLGIHGGYTQRDVMEVARCLTGWTVRERGGFRKATVEFDPALHDDGPKLVLGRRIPAGLGAADRDRVLEIVAGHPSTSRHVAGRLCRRFIGDEPAAAAVDAVAAAFRRSGGEIRTTLRELFGRPEFLEDASARGARLKRPLHFLASALRATGATTKVGPALTAHLHAMGQAPFLFPTPDGYPDASGAWGDALLPRWQLAAALAGNRIEGTSVDATRLEERAGGEESLLAHLLGRWPSAPERAAHRAVGGGARGLALALASPGFQRF